MFARLTQHIRPRTRIRLMCGHSSSKDSPPPLRKRQTEIVDQSVDTLTSVRRALISCPTGYGKTALFSSIISKIASVITAAETRNTTPIKDVVLSPTVELNRQNEEKFKYWTDGSLSTGIYGGGHYNSTADVIFATYQTFSKDNHLEKFPKVNLLIIDEAHRAPTDSYQKIIQVLLDGNPDLMILGLTATPSRADKKLLTKTFPTITYVVTLQEAIDEGVLVKPVFKTMVLKNAQDDENLKDKLFELEKRQSIEHQRYAELMDVEAANEAVVTHWKEQAGDRQTAVFCSTIDHARHVEEAFKTAGVKVGMIVTDTSKHERERCLHAYSQGDIQVIVNVAVLIEGWDDPPTSCVVLLRPSSNVNTWRQMIGRGLRAFPKKENCIVLDFGISTIIHINTPEVTGLEEEEEEEEDEVIMGNDRSMERHENDEDKSPQLLGAQDIEMEELKLNNSMQLSVPSLNLFKHVCSKPVGDRWNRHQASTKWSILQCSIAGELARSERVVNASKNLTDTGDMELTASQANKALPVSAAEDGNSVAAMLASDATHYIAVSFDVMVVVTRPFARRDDYWIAICGKKNHKIKGSDGKMKIYNMGKTPKVITSGDKRACLTAACIWWAEHYHQRTVSMDDQRTSPPTEKQILLLTDHQHSHQIAHPNFTKYNAMIIISLLLDKNYVKDAIDKFCASNDGMIRGVRRPPWRKYD